MVALLLVANTINIGADLGAMAAALQLVIGGPQFVYIGVFALLSVLLEMFIRYARYVSVLKWLTVTLFAYVGVAFVVHLPWMTALHHLVVPQLSFKADYLTVLVAILGTTISPYLFFWQAEEEVEEVKERSGAKPLERAPEQAEAEFNRIRWDTYIGMGLSNAVALFIMLTAAATLNANGVTDIQTSSQAAGGAASDRRARRVRRVRARHHRNRAVGASRAREFGRLRGRRELRLACRAHAQARAGAPLLRHNRGRHP